MLTPWSLCRSYDFPYLSDVFQHSFIIRCSSPSVRKLSHYQNSYRLVLTPQANYPILQISINMEAQNQTDELYPIAVLIDELKVVFLPAQDAPLI